MRRIGTIAGCWFCGAQLQRVVIVPDPEFRPHLITLCRQCATPEEVAHADAARTCPGCGIPMRLSRRDAVTSRWAMTCSTRCYQRALRASRRVKPRIIRCEVCWTEFQAVHVDARYCSAACKQRAYRQRQTVTARA